MSYKRHLDLNPFSLLIACSTLQQVFWSTSQILIQGTNGCQHHHYNLLRHHLHLHAFYCLVCILFCLFKCFLEYQSFLILGPPSRVCSHQVALVTRSTLASPESWPSRTTPTTRSCMPVALVAAPPPPLPGLTSPSHQSRGSLDTSWRRSPTSHSLDRSRWRFPASHTLTRVPFNSNTEYTTSAGLDQQRKHNLIISFVYKLLLSLFNIHNQLNKTCTPLEWICLNCQLACLSIRWPLPTLIIWCISPHPPLAIRWAWPSPGVRGFSRFVWIVN